MRRIQKLGMAPRIVVVVALGVAFLAAGSYLPNLGQHHPRVGWYGYAPLHAPLNAPSLGWPGWLRLVVWLALACLWAVVSIRLLRPSPHRHSDRLPK
jgi:hypothetical protein